MRTIETRVIDRLRHADRPLHPVYLQQCYAHCEDMHEDIRVLERAGLVEICASGIRWRGR